MRILHPKTAGSSRSDFSSDALRCLPPLTTSEGQACVEWTVSKRAAVSTHTLLVQGLEGGTCVLLELFGLVDVLLMLDEIGAQFIKPREDVTELVRPRFIALIFPTPKVRDPAFIDLRALLAEAFPLRARGIALGPCSPPPENHSCIDLTVSKQAAVSRASLRSKASRVVPVSSLRCSMCS